MHPSIKNMIMDMELKGFSKKTVKTYSKHVIRLAEHYNTSPEQLDSNHIREYLHYIITVRNLSRAYVNIAYSAFKFYFTITLKKEWDMTHIPRVKIASKLPLALSINQVRDIFVNVENLKHKTMLITCYSAGLRVGELLNLKCTDILSDEMSIRVRDGKGHKERYTILSRFNLICLRHYYRVYRPKEYLFENPITNRPLSPRPIQSTFQKVRLKLNLPSDARLHSLRHSFATHLLKSGVDIFTVQKLLGHASLKTTFRYIHILNVNPLEIRSPLDTNIAFEDFSKLITNKDQM